jgi:uncharacterized coiled-coil DUF342 family protein
MERTAWTDERIDDAFSQLRGEMREMRQEFRELRHDLHEEFRDVRAELSQIKLFMLAGLVTILAAFIGLHG